jgi:hypothetical protein
MKLMIGYCWAVTCAGICFILWFGFRSWLEGFESATGLPVLTSLSHLLEMLTILFLLFWPIAFCLAILPFLLTVFIARKFKIKNLFYFAFCGCITGLIADPIFVYICPRFLDSEDPTFMEECLRFAPFLIFSGAGGGIAYWWNSYRTHRFA